MGLKVTFSHSACSPHQSSLRTSTIRSLGTYSENLYRPVPIAAFPEL